MLTHIRLDEKMEAEISQLLEREMFSSKSEFIRDAIRKSIEDYKTKLAKHLINKHFGKAKIPDKIERLTEEEYEEYVKSGRDIFKEFGLK